jgi:hypothetical protein
LSRGRTRFTQSDVARILKAAAKAGVAVTIDISVDGSMRVSVGAKESDSTNPWNEAIAELSVNKGGRDG